MRNPSTLAMAEALTAMAALAAPATTSDAADRPGSLPPQRQQPRTAGAGRPSDVEPGRGPSTWAP